MPRLAIARIAKVHLQFVNLTWHVTDPSAAPKAAPASAPTLVTTTHRGVVVSYRPPPRVPGVSAGRIFGSAPSRASHPQNLPDIGRETAAASRHESVSAVHEARNDCCLWIWISVNVRVYRGLKTPPKEENRMDPLEALARAGETLYGSGWREPLARSLHRPGAPKPGINIRLLQRWLRREPGRRPPAWLPKALAGLLRTEGSRRYDECTRLAAELDPALR